ncbi:MULTISPECIES: transcription termination/antitermination protein NusG [Trueperella]|uniref:Transcription termination/antitermination protein NusG n=1 Tax=Trueperella abortisuis TaxID=445930 RepID=A0ABT9PGL9_9ACTO|nr:MULTISPECIES: transcription termination/antitermination protein NusG [Trueperella]MCI7305219.1 transcription termination/antitermination protein NusG [Trueperella sp.]MDP9831863.1 transcriptional antiterminator NusG [Trueperella abortisuis]MDY5402752.1 transcription termination/antitermination protein NusG [Trueperella sp.]
MSQSIDDIFSDKAEEALPVASAEEADAEQVADVEQVAVVESGLDDAEAPADGEEESAAAEEAAPEPEVADDGVVTEETVRERLRGLPGDWYVLHTYAGYEKRVKQDIESRAHTMNMEDFIFEVQVPMEDVYEVKKGQRKLVTRVRMPGYALIRMEMTDDSWRTVQETNGVTGFVGNGRDPVALTQAEVVQMLTPVVEQEAAEAAKAAGKPIISGAPAIVADYEVGETVTLTTEPWVGMPATISQVDAANQRLTVLMTLVGQETPVDLSFGQVEKMD